MGGAWWWAATAAAVGGASRRAGLPVGGCLPSGCQAVRLDSIVEVRRCKVHALWVPSCKTRLD